MKKIVTCLLVVMMLCGTALAEIDIDSLSKDELVDLYIKTRSKVFAQALIDGAPLPIGNYYAGKDLPSGSYVLMFDWLETDKDSDGYYWIRTFDAEDEVDEYLIIRYPIDQTRIELPEGYRLNVQAMLMDHSPTVKIKLFESFFLGF